MKFTHFTHALWNGKKGYFLMADRRSDFCQGCKKGCKNNTNVIKIKLL